MKFRPILLGATLVALGCSDSAPVADGASAGEDASLGPVVIAHRGFSGRAPEHTLLAWDLARDAGADYLEQDLQMTADGVLVVLHDATLDRTARGPAENCSGPVIEKTLEQIRTCDVGTWFNERRSELADRRFPDLRISTLEEVLQRYGTTVRYYIETKNPEEAPGMEEELIRLLREHRLVGPAEGMPRVYVQSFSPESLRKIRSFDPEIPLVQLFERAPSEELRDSLEVVSTYAAGVGPHFSSVDAAFVDAAHAAGIVVHPYTVNDPAEMRRLTDIGTDGFFTDEPQLARSLLTPDP